MSLLVEEVEFNAEVTAIGQITIPIKIRKRLGLKYKTPVKCKVQRFIDPAELEEKKVEA